MLNTRIDILTLTRTTSFVGRGWAGRTWIAALLAGTAELTLAATAAAQTAPTDATAQTAPTDAAARAVPPVGAPRAVDNSGQTVNQDATGMSDIVVTARKKSETLLEVPLAITALSSAVIEKRGIDSLISVADYTPSLNVSSFGNGTTNRAQQTVIIRGMVPGSTYSYTSTVFINGAPLGASGLIDGISDVAQVEVVKGPQSAYFGRATFAGAINIITRAPGTEFKATADVLYGSYDWTDIKGTIEGPIIPGILSARVTGRYYKIDGQYDAPNNPGYKFGGQESKNILGELKFTPTDTLTVRAFGAYITTDDGLQPLVKFNRSTFNCNPAPTTAYVCGTLPARLPTGPNVDIPSSFFANLRSPAAGIRYKDIGLDHAGSATEIRIGTLNVTYAFPDSGWSISSVTAANETFADSIQDGSNTYQALLSARQPSDIYSYNRSFNQELRVTSDQNKRLRGLLGVNYAYFRQGQTVMSLAPPTSVFVVSAANIVNRNNTFAIFGSASFDLTPELTLNGEGRYQISKTQGYSRKLDASNNAVEAPVGGLQITTHEFLPRAILQYKFAPQQQFYATFSKGTNPGLFNTAFATYNPAFQQYITDTLGGSSVVQPEKITNYEFGYKGQLLDGRLQFDADIYLAKWRNQLILQSLRVSDTALTGLPGTTSVNIYSNNGATDLKGIEANVYYRFSSALSASVGGSLNDTKLVRYTNTAAAALLGFTGSLAPLTLFTGNELPYASKYSANVNVDYAHAVSNDLEGFVHADFIYKSGTYGDPANFNRTPDAKRVNLRIGLNAGRQKIEAFAENLFDNRAYLSTSPGFDINDANRSIAVAVLPMPRRVGIRFHTEY